MGVIPSKEPHCDLECFAAIHGRYTQIGEELTVFTQHVKVAGKSSRIESPLYKRTKLDASESVTKNSPCKIRQPPRGHRHLTLPMIIRRRPSYRKALRETNCISNFVQKKTIKDYNAVKDEKVIDNRVNHAEKEQKNVYENAHTEIQQCGTDKSFKISEVSINLKRTAFQITEEKKEKLTLKICRRYSTRNRPYGNSKLPTNEMPTKQNTVSERSLKQSAKNGELEIDTEKIMRDLRTAYELKKNLRKQVIEGFYTKEKSTFKIKNHQSQGRTPYEKVEPKPAADINNQTEPPQQQETKSVLLMEIENKLHKLRKTGRKEILDIERPHYTKPYFVTCLPAAQTIMKERLLAELKQYFAKNNNN